MSARLVRLLAALACLTLVGGCGDGEDPPTNDTQTDDTASSDVGDEDAAVTRACNGHPELCDRRVDQVVFATTHNAMSNADEGWLAPNQEFGLQAQLDAGVRAMMLDTHAWKDDLYLCHATCEFGSRPLVEGLTVLRDFLLANPNEVLVLIVQDEIPTADTTTSLADSGLTDLAYVHPAGAEWPTLAALIAANTRVVVTLENGTAPPAHLHNAWDVMWDTPYSFESEDDFSCACNRGCPSDGKALYLMNHWITNPLPNPTAAETVNTYASLHGRATACQAESGQLVNFVAVDFYATGDLFEVVDVLNGVRAAR